MNLTTDEARLLGYLLQNGDTRLVTLCMDLSMQIIQLSQMLDDLKERGIISSRGYASHTECYYVPDSRIWRYNHDRSLEEVGKAYARQL